MAGKVDRGNSVGDAARFTERYYRVGLAVADLGLWLEGSRGLTVELVGLSVRGPRSSGDDVLVTLRGLNEDGLPVVAFSGGSCLEDALVTALNRANNGTLKWREDGRK
jgi:hypothetical protein